MNILAEYLPSMVQPSFSRSLNWVYFGSSIALYTLKWKLDVSVAFLYVKCVYLQESGTWKLSSKFSVECFTL